MRRASRPSHPWPGSRAQEHSERPCGGLPGGAPVRLEAPPLDVTFGDLPLGRPSACIQPSFATVPVGPIGVVARTGCRSRSPGTRRSHTRVRTRHSGETGTEESGLCLQRLRIVVTGLTATQVTMTLPFAHRSRPRPRRRPFPWCARVPCIAERGPRAVELRLPRHLARFPVPWLR